MCECFEVYCLSVEVPHIEPLNHLVEELKSFMQVNTLNATRHSSGMELCNPLHYAPL